MTEQMLIDFLHGKVAAAELGAALIASGGVSPVSAHRRVGRRWKVARGRSLTR